MQRIAQVYPSFQDSVGLYVVGSNFTQTLERLVNNQNREGYPGEVAEPSSNMLTDFRVLKQSTKVGIDATGAIVYRAGFGDVGGDGWQGVFEDLASGAS